ncbi:hypothetical protein UlMin_038004 [Ulmus minor]
MTPIIRYLEIGKLPADKIEARALRTKAARYVFKFGQLYKRGYSNPLLKCITPKQGLYVMQEIHEGLCGNHAGQRSLLHKVVRQGYYWPNMVKDAEQYVRKCDTCQRFSQLIHQSAKIFGIPHSLVSDNGTQFDSVGLRELCSELGIKKHFFSVAHPQSNGQVEVVNKTI